MGLYVQQIVGRVKWRHYCKKSLIQNFVTVSDEALALLAIDNSEFVWEAQELDEQDVPAAKYTNKRSKRRVQEGWSQEGRVRFNLYFDMVAKHRSDNTRKNFEAKYLSEEAGGSGTSSTTSNDNNSIQKGEPIVIKDDMDVGFEAITTTSV
jgi:hypothetical protein